MAPEGLFGEFAHGVLDGLGVDDEAAVGIAFDEGGARGDGRLVVGSRQDERAALGLKKDAIEDGQVVL